LQSSSKVLLKGKGKFRHKDTLKRKSRGLWPDGTEARIFIWEVFAGGARVIDMCD
jgi:hypothetical protein